jgi:REP element-mobilizing transposase RayT
MRMDHEKERPKRKPTRLKHFDYSANGLYFITICTENRKSILSTIPVVGEGSPLPQLSRYGKIVDEWIHKLPDNYPGISIDHYVIMPNHIHLLLSVIRDDGRGDPSPTIDSAVGWLKYHATSDINKVRGTSREKIFQRSFYDHIVRNYEDYCEIHNYIHQNPVRWKQDKLYSKEYEENIL